HSGICLQHPQTDRFPCHAQGVQYVTWISDLAVSSVGSLPLSPKEEEPPEKGTSLLQSPQSDRSPCRGAYPANGFTVEKDLQSPQSYRSPCRHIQDPAQMARSELLQSPQSDRSPCRNREIIKYSAFHSLAVSSVGSLPLSRSLNRSSNMRTLPCSLFSRIAPPVAINAPTG